MATAWIFTGKVPSIHHRFYDSGSIQAWVDYVENNNLYIEANIEGVPQFPTLKYVDLTFDTALPFEEITKISYVLFSSTPIATIPPRTTEFLAFVEGVEQNECDDGYSIRVYYSIDWWDTLLLQGKKPFITGDIIRAHINDFENGYRTLKYTTDTMEVVPSSYDNEVISLPFPFPDDNSEVNVVVNGVQVLFYHLVVAEPFIREQGGTGKLAQACTVFGGMLDNTPIITGLYEIIIPVYRYETVNNDVRYTMFPCRVGSVQCNCVNYADITTITTDKIAGVYFTKAMPKNASIVNNEIVFSDTYYVAVEPTRTTPAFSPVPMTKENNAFDLSASVFLSKIEKSYSETNLSSYSRPTSYSDYYNRYIVKYTSEVYDLITIKVGDENINILYNALSNNARFRYTVEPTTGMFLFQYDNNIMTEYSKLSIINTTILSSPIITENYWDRFTAGVNAYKNIVSAVSTPISMAYNIGQGNVLGTISQASNMAVLPLEAYRNFAFSNGALRQGKSVPQVVAGMTFDSFPSLYRVKCKDEEVKINLMLYGYNTHLQPYEVLENHPRYNYNFIRTNGAIVVDEVASYPRNIVTDIESMFDRGLWLHHFASGHSYAELFNLFVNNYPTRGFGNG